MTVGTFPFGQPIKRVVQTDRSPKRVFVLGVYASAVHARWCNDRGKQLVKALAVASEPYIFWHGDPENVKEILSAVEVPPGVGRLEPAASNLNGPSGRSIDEDYLEPLRLTRDDAWLCDLVPHSCKNQGQAEALKKHYEHYEKDQVLPAVKWPTVPRKLADPARRKQIAAELRESAAEVIITLGDMPLEWFGSAFGSAHTLGAYGRDPRAYGSPHDFEIEGRILKLLPLVHPRQAAGLSGHSPEWKDVHANWKLRIAPGLLTSR